MHSDVRLQVRALRVHLITAVKVALVHLSLLQALVVAVARKSAAVGRFTRRLEVAVVRRFACGKEIGLACLESKFEGDASAAGHGRSNAANTHFFLWMSSPLDGCRSRAS